MEGEVEGYKKSVQKEQEQNEKLMFVHNKTEADIATTKKLLQQVQERHEALKNEYATYTRMLQETELALNRANSVSPNACVVAILFFSSYFPSNAMTRCTNWAHNQNSDPRTKSL